MIAKNRTRWRLAVMSVLLLLPALFFPKPWSTTGGAALATPPTACPGGNLPPVCSENIVYGKAGMYCSASGTPPLSYQWRRGTTNLVNGGNIDGATTNTLTIWPATFADAGNDYNCVVSNAEGSTVGGNIILTVFATGTGDVNGDGVTDSRDVQAFVSARLAQPPPPNQATASFCAADMDGNGDLGCEDTCVFVQLLLQSPLGCGMTPENDDCPNAILVTTGVIYSGSTSYATRDAPHLSCEYGCEPACNTAPDVWFKWTADFSGHADFTMCDASRYDTIMALFDACPAIGGVELLAGCNDDSGCGYSSRIVNYPVNAGQNYWICITGWEGRKGCFTFRVIPHT